MDARTLDLLSQAIPYFEPKVESSHGIDTLVLPTPAGADYTFSLHEEHSEAERQISGQLVDGNIRGSTFWYIALEGAAYGDDWDKLASYYFEMLSGILASPTRIVYKKGLLLDDYTLEISDGDSWKKFGGVSSLRIGCGPGPKIQGRKHIYSSPPISKYESS
jgi:hypothetical protein